MSNILSTKVALCIGATSGIGRAIAFKLVNLKVNVALVARNQSLAEEMILEFKRINPQGKFEYFKCDCSSLHQISHTCSEFLSKFTKVRIYIFDNLLGEITAFI